MIWGEAENDNLSKKKNLFKIKSKNEILSEINNKDNIGNYKDINNDKEMENMDENKIDIDEYENKNEIKLVLYDNVCENNNINMKLKEEKPIVNNKNSNEDFGDLMDFDDLDIDVDERKK